MYSIHRAGNSDCPCGNHQRSEVKPQVEIVLSSVLVNGARTFLAVCVVLGLLIGEVTAINRDDEMVVDDIPQ
jgi:hypothetical protein